MDSNADMTTLQNADNDHEIQFTGTSPQILVEGTAENPYYSIMYVDTSARETYVGFGSYYLENVFHWLKEYFGQERAKIVDPDDYRPTGRWVIEKKHTASQNPYMDDSYYASATCSECNFCIHAEIGSFGYPKLNTTNYCPNCGAKMEG